jgi:pimeloyl-ACP methyl ester carboxylesterase
MTLKKLSSVEHLTDLYARFAAGGVSRRDFMRSATALGVAGAAASALGPLTGSPTTVAAQALAAAGPQTIPLDLAEWSYMWVNVKRVEMARGHFINGQQMYVEYMVPSRVTKPYPIVLVHGGGGQGLDWMGTPDGRPGWFQYLVSQGYRVYVVDRPGHGRSPQHMETHNGFPARAGTLENISGRFTPPNATATNEPGPFQHLHNQWVGEGTVGSEDLDQFVASQGGSYVQGGGGGGGFGNQRTPEGLPVPANQRNVAFNIQHATWREAGADLLDQIGPAIIMTHSAGGPFGLLSAEARPELVKATVIVEGVGSPFGGGNVWGVSSIPVTYDPPAREASEIALRWVPGAEEGVEGYYLQQEPARRLPKLAGTKVVFVTGEGSFAAPGYPGAVAFLRQAGVEAEELRLVDHGIHGNGHMMMVERNHAAVLGAITGWLDTNVNAGAEASTVPTASDEFTGMKLADYGYFWVGTEHKAMDYGTILAGQMYVQEMVPQEVRFPVPVVLVHGGGGSMLHSMGLGGNAGWAHYYLQAGFRVYLVDRPGHGRTPYHPDALGEIRRMPALTQVTRDLMAAASAPSRRWNGTGDVGDPLVDQFMAGQNAAPRDGALAMQLWRSRGAELLDRIGPAVIQTHSAGGPFGWVVADERPDLVRAVVCYEGGNFPGMAQGDRPAVPMPGLRGLRALYFTAENSGPARAVRGPAIVEALNEIGANAEHVNLGDVGIAGNSHFSMFETNRKEIFEFFRGWLEDNVQA